MSSEHLSPECQSPECALTINPLPDFAGDASPAKSGRVASERWRP